MSARFLIVRLGALGDVIHGIPVAAALRAHAPGAEIDWLAEPRYADMLSLVTVLDRRIPLDVRGPAATLLRTIRRLRRANYDAVIDLQGLIKSAALARAAGGRRTIGFASGHRRENAAGLFYTTVVDPGAARHVIAKNLALLEPLGVRSPRIDFPLDVRSTAVARAVVERCGVAGYALLNPGAAWPNKRWPADRFGAVAAALSEAAGVRSVVLWGPGERPLADAVVAASGGAAELSPPTSIADLFAMSVHARLLVSGDTGPLHVAAACGTPVVALFGPTSPERNGPWSAGDLTLSRAATCECLYQRRCHRAARCIDDITTAEVVAAVQQRVGARG